MWSRRNLCRKQRGNELTVQMIFCRWWEMLIIFTLAVPTQRWMTNRALWTRINHGASFSPTWRTTWSSCVSFFPRTTLVIFWKIRYLLMFWFHWRDVKILLRYGWSYWLHLYWYLDKLIFPFLFLSRWVEMEFVCIWQSEVHFWGSKAFSTLCS